MAYQCIFYPGRQTLMNLDQVFPHNPKHVSYSTSLTASYTKQFLFSPTPTIDLVLFAHRLRDRRGSSPLTGDNYRTLSTGCRTTPHRTRNRARQNPWFDSYSVIRSRLVLGSIFRVSPKELQNLFHTELTDIGLSTTFNCLIGQLALLLLKFEDALFDGVLDCNLVDYDV
jgi:hypothetical protein